MAFAQDLLTRIINVNSGGATIFVAAGSAFVLYAEVSKSDLAEEPSGGFDIFEDLGSMAFTNDYAFSEIGAASYRRTVDKITGKEQATFIVGGDITTQDPATLSLFSHSIAMVSHDGKSWTKSFEKTWESEAGSDSSIYAFAWDTDKFYGLVYSTEGYYSRPGGFGYEVNSYERSLTSDNGDAWQEAGSELRYNSEGNPPPNLTPPSLFYPHVNPKAMLPDGVYGYVEQRDNSGLLIESYLVKPTKYDAQWYLNARPVFSDLGDKVSITVVKGGVTSTQETITPIQYVMCAAYQDGILMAGGTRIIDGNERALIAASIDNGNNWHIIWEGPERSDEGGWFRVRTITSAPAAAKGAS
jgi:hypothetical protein